jgi:D-glycero-alpha-D-manno-heptose 1-phosphate guanylyltransferase
MEAIVLAGGLGTRLQSIISELPKPMAPIANKPFLFYLLKWLEKNGVSRVILSVGHKWEIIFNEFGEHFNSVELVYSVEDLPLGTGGAISLAMSRLKNDHFFIINGDTLFDVNLDYLLSFHKTNAYDLSVTLKPMSNFDRYGTVEIDENNRIINFYEKSKQKVGLINGGVYIANISIFKHFPHTEKFSFERDFLEKMINKLSFGGLINDEYFIDIGIPSDYKKARFEIANRLNIKHFL